MINKIKFQYEPLLENFGDTIFALKKAKLEIDKALEDFDLIKSEYSAQKCSV
jgi:hypothetical protein